jgi:hypothetical protein
MKLSASDPLDSLVDLACRDGVDIRPTLLRVLTDLYVQKPIHGLEEETQYVELALGLIDAVDAPTRAAVASRLSAYPAAPAAILHKLANGPSPATSAGEAPEGSDLIELFFSARPEERRLILVNLDVAWATATRRAVPAAGEMVRRLENAALRRNQDEFIRVLERALGVGRELAERVARDNSGEPVVVAAKALGIKAEVLQRILLYELSHLFDELNPAAAERMVSIWRTTAPRHPVHEPVYWNDERSSPRPAARPAPNRALSRDERPAKSRSSDR